MNEQVKKQDTKVKFAYAVLTLDDIKKQINPTDAELKSFYDQNKQQYVNSIPEKVKARYILIDTAKLGEKIPVTQAQVQQYYNQHQDEFRIPETVTVRHILIKTPTPGADGKVDQKGVDAARAKADDILKQLKCGTSFADLAKKNSDDPGSAQNGGLLPPLTKVAPFLSSSRLPSTRQSARPPESFAPATVFISSTSKPGSRRA